MIQSDLLTDAKITRSGATLNRSWVLFPKTKTLPTIKFMGPIEFSSTVNKFEGTLPNRSSDLRPKRSAIDITIGKVNATV